MSAGNCDYDFAMLVNENINVDEHCGRMPATASGLTFTNGMRVMLALVAVVVEVVTLR